ncbi:MAG: N-formylglutamate amidohydrolase [Chromatiales bacterium]|nr:N-formylglutamate amidohydrolase [Chromatiales bacterium]
MDTLNALIAPDEPAAFSLLDVATPTWPVLIVCDHASNRVPRALDQLGLPEAALLDHVAWDIGAGGTARELGQRLGLPVLLNNYSRLVIDCNRKLDDLTSIAVRSDGWEIPGNQGVDEAGRERRADAIFHPYHLAIEARLARFAGTVPAVIAIHSFTPQMAGLARPWHVGVLWDTDPRIAMPLLEGLRALPGIVVGDNEPYSGRHPADYTMDHHGEAAGRPHVSLELRQDLLGTAEAVSRWAGLLAEVLTPILAAPSLYTRWPS